jgi:hypothetical protein
MKNEFCFWLLIAPYDTAEEPTFTSSAWASNLTTLLKKLSAVLFVRLGAEQARAWKSFVCVSLCLPSTYALTKDGKLQKLGLTYILLFHIFGRINNDAGCRSPTPLWIYVLTLGVKEPPCDRQLLQETHYHSTHSPWCAWKWAAGLSTNLLHLTHSQWIHSNSVLHGRDSQGLKIKEGQSLTASICTQFSLGLDGLLPWDHHYINHGLDIIQALPEANKKAWLHGIQIARELYFAC